MSFGNTRRAPVDRARGAAHHAAAEAKPWVEWLARAGFAAKGLVYVLIGLLALQAALGAGGRTTDATGALRTVLEQPFGQVLLGIVAVGLFGYALWRLVEATVNPEGGENDAKGIAKRIGYAVSGLAYAAIGVAAVRMILGSGGGSSGESSAQDWTARLLSQPFGQWLVGLVGAAVIAVGLYFIYLGYTAKFRSKLKTAEMTQDEEKWTVLAGRVGHVARGIVFGLIGIFLIQAALQTDAGEARGLGGALSALGNQPYGPWLLALVAAGLAAYGAYMFLAARYRRVWA